MSHPSQDTEFQHLVLAALWVLIRAAWGQKDHRAATNFQSGAIDFGDRFGRQSETAREYRREITYGGRLV